MACSAESKNGKDQEIVSETAPPVIEVTASDFAFEAPDSIPSGWSTIRIKNTGTQHHFINLILLPEGENFGDYTREVAPAFDKALVAMRSGEMSKSEVTNKLIQDLPNWIFPLGFRGGPGLTAPGLTTQATVKLEPGNYIMECYVKTPEGQFHSARGMVRPLTVTSDSTNAEPPKADIKMTLENNEIKTEGELTPGSHTFEVAFGSHPEGSFPNDVHLAKISEGTSIDSVAAWMDWMTALQAPAPVTFVGGIQNRPAGDTAYFTVDLEPGNYVWVSEEHAADGMLKKFTVE